LSIIDDHSYIARQPDASYDFNIDVAFEIPDAIHEER